MTGTYTHKGHVWTWILDGSTVYLESGRCRGRMVFPSVSAAMNALVEAGAMEVV